MDFVGHKISEHGIEVLDYKVEAARKFPLPKTVKEVSRSSVCAIITENS